MTTTTNTLVRNLIALIAAVLLPIAGSAQFQMPVAQPVQTQLAQRPVAGHDDLVDIVLIMDIAAGWHVYGPDNTGGPIPLTFKAEQISGATLQGGVQLSPSPKRVQDAIFDCEVTYVEVQATATQRLKLTGGDWHVQGFFQYAACNDQTCTAPTPVEVDFSGTLTAPAPAAATASQPATAEPAPAPAEAESRDNDDTEAAAAPDSTATTVADTAQQPAEMTAIDWSQVAGGVELDEASGSSRSLAGIFLLGLLGGLLALLTPCVWPIIPMTVSFFLKRAKDNRKKGIRDAVLYGASIITIYVGLGLLVTLIWGPSSLNALSTNAVFNIFLFLLLVVFAASFLGGFELALPSSWSTRLDSKATSATGLASIFLMALTLVLVSFSCTGPIIGFLLVDMITSGSVVAPTVGMLGFAIALAAPFTLFALFPSWLQSMPRSGGWMNVVKVVLGLVELAFALKFLSVADLAYGWRLLDRETFLCLWIAIFALMGCYLLGWIRLPHDEDEYDEMGNIVVRPRIGVTRFLLALCAFAFTIYMIPGLWGAPCKAVSAFAPPMWTQDFRLGDQSVEATYTDYEEGMEAARRAGKPVMLDFTGYGCVNCRKMEAAVWTDQRVRGIMTNDYVLISLYVDDKTPLPETLTVTEADDSERRLRTVGDRWSYLQRTRFGAQTQPFYVLLDNDGEPLAQPYSYNEDVDMYIRWLRGGLDNYK